MLDTPKNAVPKEILQDAIAEYIAKNKSKLSEELYLNLEALNAELTAGVSLILVCGKLFSWDRDVKRKNSEKKAANEKNDSFSLKAFFNNNKEQMILADNPDAIVFAIGKVLKGFAFTQAHIIYLLEEYKKSQASDDKQEKITALQSKVLFYTEEEQLFKVVIAGLEKFREPAVADTNLSRVIVDLEGYRDLLSQNKAKLTKSSSASSGSDTESSVRSGSGSLSSSPTSSRVIDEVSEDFQAFADSINEELKVEAQEAAAKLAYEEAERKAVEERVVALQQEVNDFQDSITAEIEEARIAEENRARLAREEAERVAAKAAEERVVALQQEVNDFQDSIIAEIEEDRIAEEVRIRLAKEEADRVAAEAERAAKEKAERIAAEAKLAAQKEAERVAAEKETARFHAKWGNGLFKRFYEEADDLAKEISERQKTEKLAESNKKLVQELDGKIEDKKDEIIKITQMMATTEYKEAELVRAQKLQDDIKLTRARMKDVSEEEVSGAVNYLTERFERDRTENPRNLSKLQAELADLENQKAFVLGDKSVVEKLQAQQQALTQQIAAQEELIENTEKVISDFRQTSEQRKKIITDTLKYRLGMQRSHLVSKHDFKKTDIEAYEKNYAALDDAGQQALVKKAAKKWWDYIPIVRSIDRIESAYMKREKEVGMLFRYSSQIDDISSGLKEFSRPNIEQEVRNFNNTTMALHNMEFARARDGVVPAGSLPYVPINTQNIANLVSDHEKFKLNCDVLPSQKAERKRLYSQKYDVDRRLNEIMPQQPAGVSAEQAGLRK